MVNPRSQMPRLTALAKGYMRSRIFLTALDLNVFGHLGSSKKSAHEMAESMKTDERATEILLNALVAMELLTRTDQLYSNIDGIADLLIPGRPDYRGAGFRHDSNLWEAWSRLTERVKSGTFFGREWTPDMSREMAMAMLQNSRVPADSLMRAVDFSKVRTLLDLGGGPGSWSLALARRYPNLKATIFDKDRYALEIAQEEINKQGLNSRVDVVEGDFFHDDFGTGYDMVFLSLILCICGEDENARLLEKVCCSLTGTGKVVIRDAILDENKTQPAPAAIFAVNMLVATPHGRAYSYPEIKNLLQRTGFSDIYRLPLEDLHLVIGNKAGHSL